jgi:hypothetical protein
MAPRMKTFRRPPASFATFLVAHPLPAYNSAMTVREEELHDRRRSTTSFELPLVQRPKPRWSISFVQMVTASFP